MPSFGAESTIHTKVYPGAGQAWKGSRLLTGLSTPAIVFMIASTFFGDCVCRMSTNSERVL